MARLAAWWRRSNLAKLVALRKGNHPGEAYVRRDQEKIYTEQRGTPWRGSMRKQRYSVWPLDVGKTWPSAKIHV